LLSDYDSLRSVITSFVILIAIRRKSFFCGNKFTKGRASTYLGDLPISPIKEATLNKTNVNKTWNALMLDQKSSSGEIPFHQRTGYCHWHKYLHAGQSAVSPLSIIYLQYFF
jgi:hypothetical protein